MMSYNKYNDDGSCSNSEYAVDVYVWNQVRSVEGQNRIKFPNCITEDFFSLPPRQSLESRYHVFDCLGAQPLLNAQMREGVLKWICSVNRQG